MSNGQELKKTRLLIKSVKQWHIRWKQKDGILNFQKNWITNNDIEICDKLCKYNSSSIQLSTVIRKYALNDVWNFYI